MSNQDQRRQRGQHPRAELVLAEDEHRRALELMEQDGLVEERDVVVVRGPPVAGGDHLARGFRVMRLVGIPEGRRAEPPEQDDKQQ